EFVVLFGHHLQEARGKRWDDVRSTSILTPALWLSSKKIAYQREKYLAVRNERRVRAARYRHCLAIRHAFRQRFACRGRREPVAAAHDGEQGRFEFTQPRQQVGVAQDAQAVRKAGTCRLAMREQLPAQF